MKSELLCFARRIALLTAIAMILLSATGAAEDIETNQQWANRNNDAAAVESARLFLALIRLDGSTRRPELDAVAQLAKDDKPVEAMSRFCDYFTTKLRYAESYGIAAQDIDPFQSFPNPTRFGVDSTTIIAAGKKVLGNVVPLGGHDVNIGEPGAVNWNAGTEKGGDPAGDLALHTGEAFFPLLRAYLVTQDRAYLDKWVDFVDDWCLNDHYFNTVDPCEVPDHVNTDTSHSAVALMRLLTGVSRVTPEGKSPIPPRVLANVLRRVFAEGLPFKVAYTRSNTHNWTPDTELLLVAQFYDEFKASALYLREARRRAIEDHAVTQNLRDGSENQQDPWYNAVYLNMRDAVRIVQGKSVTPGWMDLQDDMRWKNEIEEHLKERLTFQIHLRTPQGQWPIVLRGSDKRVGFVGSYNQSLGEAYLDCPAAFQDPVNLSILTALTNPTAGVRAKYDSEWFPYGGYNLVRDGWEPDSGSASMFCSPVPGAYGAYRSRSNNNTLGINGYGQDLLIEDTTQHYMYPTSPINVDGKNQFFHAGLYRVEGVAGHKVYQVSAWTEPSDFRWHASSSLNLMEGVYSGAWAEPEDAPTVGMKDGKEVKSISIPLDRTLQGITHQRLAMYLRKQKLWIVTDRMLASGQHNYEQVWWMPLSTEENQLIYPSFMANQVHVDEANRSITTDAATVMIDNKPVPKVNLSMSQFTDAALAYKTTETPPGSSPNPRLRGWGRLRIGASWKGDGSQQIVTTIQPRPGETGAEAQLQNVQTLQSGKQARGFRATAPGGVLVQYLAAPSKEDDLKLGELQLRGESLLLADDIGMALGCRELTVNGKPVADVPPDFEFRYAGGAITQIVPIYRPIDPVKIGPASNVFIDSVDVALATHTAGVEMRYTIDGSEPTPQSTLYEGPFKLDRSAVVKARAYRRGVTENPPVLSGTHATVTSMAVFDKAPQLIEAVKLPKPVPGLKFRYWQDDWRKMFLDLDALQPSVNSEVSELWDLKLVPDDNSALGKQPAPRKKYFAVEYAGYLDIPSDGVYTLHAPREFIYPDTEAGYELRVYLGKRLDRRATVPNQPLNEWYPSTRLHALGNWSVGLSKGLQPFRVVWIDWRRDAASRLNQKGIRDYIWTGATPDLRISGPGVDEQPIPASWFRH